MEAELGMAAQLGWQEGDMHRAAAPVKGIASTGRTARLQAALAEREVDGLLVSQPENRAYLSGFTGSSGWLLIVADREGQASGVPMIATDSRYFEQARLECPDYELVQARDELVAVLPGMVARASAVGARSFRLAFEADHATFADVERWSAALPGVQLVPTQGLVMGLRKVKDPSEIAAVRAAVALADAALAAALAQIRPGMRERDVAWLIESHMRTHGAEGASFETIVACGPNGARPHARAGDDLLVAGEPIVIDMGARLNRYCSDLTRTVCIGPPNDPERFSAIYETVLQAQSAAEAALRPGLAGRDADAVARGHIAEAGYADYFGHGLGHGVGLEIHEGPRLGRTSDDVLAPGNVVTVEPGIYLPGWGGVRIEDIVLITETGAEILTRAPKTPILPVHAGHR